MRILMVGLGAISATYGTLLQEAGHEVEHVLRPGSTAAGIEQVTVHLLDGRGGSRTGTEWAGTCAVTHARPGTSYDLIVCAIGCLDLPAVVDTLSRNSLSGPMLVFSGTWQDRAHIEEALEGRPHALAYPVAGGRLDRPARELDAVVFDHVVLEGGNELSGNARRGDTSRGRNTGRGDGDSSGNAGRRDGDSGDGGGYADPGTLTAARRALSSVGLTCETPADMLQWIWVHMAINAAVISEAARGADLSDPSAAAERLMDGTSRLRRVIVSIRECLAIVAARGVDLARFRGEVAPYRIPALLAAPVMRRMFARNALTRRIMTLHSNPADLVFICRSVEEEGRRLGVPTPHFHAAYEEGIARIALRGHR